MLGLQAAPAFRGGRAARSRYPDPLIVAALADDAGAPVAEQVALEADQAGVAETIAGMIARSCGPGVSADWTP